MSAQTRPGRRRDRQRKGSSTLGLRQSVLKPPAGSTTVHGQPKPRGATPVHPLLRLQQSVGNRAVARLIQAKLQRSEPGGAHERETDRVAEQTMRMVEPGRQNGASNIETEALAQRKAVAEGAGVGTAPPIVDEVLDSPGQPLQTKLRINEPGDAYEQAAARVMGTTEIDSRVAHWQSGAPPRAPSGQPRPPAAPAQSRRDVPVLPVRDVLIQRQPKSDGPSVRDVPILLEKLELDVGDNLLDYGHHLYRAATLYRDDPDALKEALGRYALGANVLKDTYQFLGFKADTAGKLAVGTGIVTKGVTLLRAGELTLDFQFNVGRGVKFETNLNLGVNPKDLTDVRKAEVHFGLVRRF